MRRKGIRHRPYDCTSAASSFPYTHFWWASYLRYRQSTVLSRTPRPPRSSSSSAPAFPRASIATNSCPTFGSTPKCLARPSSLTHPRRFLRRVSLAGVVDSGSSGGGWRKEREEARRGHGVVRDGDGSRERRSKKERDGSRELIFDQTLIC